MKPLALVPTALLALGLAALAAGCGGGAAGGETSGRTTGPGSSAETVLVDVRTGVGGFTPAEVAIENRPEFGLYGDGTVVIRGPEGGTLPRPWTYRLSQAGIDAVLEAAAKANLLSDPPDYGLPPVTDVGSTTVTLDAAGQTVVHDAYALGYEHPPADGLTPAQRDARAALQGFVDFVAGLPGARPDLIDSEPGPYQPEAVDVHVWPAPEETPSTAVLEWPLATRPEDIPATAGLPESRCTTVRGADLEALEQALEGAGAWVAWRSGARTWSSGFHVVLPGEESCGGEA